MLFCALSLLKTGSMLLGESQQTACQEGQQVARGTPVPVPVPVPRLRKEWEAGGRPSLGHGCSASTLKLEYNLQHL